VLHLKIHDTWFCESDEVTRTLLTGQRASGIR
jgi:hypothetical protein